MWAITGPFPTVEIEPGELPELKVSIKGVQAATVNTRKVAVDHVRRRSRCSTPETIHFL